MSNPPPLRVLQFLAQYPGRDGTSAYGTGLARAMNRIWPGSCPILSLRPDERPAPEGVELVRHPRTERNPFRLPASLKAELASNRQRLDGVVLHGTYHPGNAAMARELRRQGIPYVFMPHDPYVPGLTRHHALRKWLYWHAFEKHVAARACAVQLLDETHEDPLRARGIEVPVFAVPNGCDPELLDDPTLRLTEPGKQAEVRIQYLGRMDRNHKGLDLLIEGFARFVAGGGAAASYELVLTGNDWEDRASLERLAAHRGVGERVRFTGPRPESSSQIQGEADLVVLASRFDGFGLTVMEAMLVARPVLVSTRAGVAGHVAKARGGWLFEPEPEAIAKAMEQASRSRDEWPEMGRRNQDYVLKNLTWEQVARRTMEGYRRVFA